MQLPKGKIRIPWKESKIIIRNLTPMMKDLKYCTKDLDIALC